MAPGPAADVTRALAPRAGHFLALALSALGLHCAHAGDGGSADDRPTRLVLPGDTVGLSGLGRTEDGALWAVAENQRVALRIVGRRIERIPVTGVPPQLELESIAALGRGRFALGTESDVAGRSGDEILFAELEGGTLRARPGLMCPYDLWGLVGEDNQGIEGLCEVDGALVLAAEVTSVDEQGRRFAPIARRGISGGWSRYRLPLTSPDGKLSAIACRPLPAGQIEVHVIERHFGVMRVLRAVIPPVDRDVDLVPQLRLNLDEWVGERPLPPNFEGLEILPDGRAVMVVDNFYRGMARGPSELWWFPMDRVLPRAPVPRASAPPAEPVPSQPRRAP
ncbi:MAG: esterase-like activity of phytase family protein [Myxococcota bacterium]